MYRKTIDEPDEPDELEESNGQNETANGTTIYCPSSDLEADSTDSEEIENCSM